MSKKTEPKEALKVLKDRIHYSLYELNEATKNDTHSRLIRSIRVLDELVDKATPMKPAGYHTDYNCPTCNKRVRSGKGSSSRIKDTVCRNCYQVLDWSEND